MKFLIKLILILLIGAVGGIFGTQFFLPYLASKPYFDRFEFIRRGTDGTTIINKQDQIIVRENEQLEKMVEKTVPSVVGIRTTKSGKVIFEGSGMAVTGDGLVLALNPFVSVAQEYFVLVGGKELAAEIVQKDVKTNLVLLKVKESSLTAISFGSGEILVLGERVVMIGADMDDKDTSKFLNTGIISSLNGENFSVNFTEMNQKAIGGPLFNIKGEVLGAAIFDKKGKLSFIPIRQIKEFVSNGLK